MTAEELLNRLEIACGDTVDPLVLLNFQFPMQGFSEGINIVTLPSIRCAKLVADYDTESNVDRSLVYLYHDCTSTHGVLRNDTEIESYIFGGSGYSYAELVSDIMYAINAENSLLSGAVRFGGLLRRPTTQGFGGGGLDHDNLASRSVPDPDFDCEAVLVSVSPFHVRGMKAVVLNFDARRQKAFAGFGIGRIPSIGELKYKNDPGDQTVVRR